MLYYFITQMPVPQEEVIAVFPSPLSSRPFLFLLSFYKSIAIPSFPWYLCFIATVFLLKNVRLQCLTATECRG